jgi:hypothetical protein
MRTSAAIVGDHTVVTSRAGGSHTAAERPWVASRQSAAFEQLSAPWLRAHKRFGRPSLAPP